MTKNNMHDDEKHDDEYSVHEEDTDRGIMYVLREKIGLGYVAFALLIAVIVFLGAKNKIMEYFTKTSEVTQAQIKEPANRPTSQLESAIPARADNQLIPADSGVLVATADSVSTATPDTKEIVPADVQAPAVVAASETSDKAIKDISDNALVVGTSQAVMHDEKMKDALKDFIMNNPEVIIESLAKLQQKRMQESKEYVNKSADKIVSGKPFIGNKDGNTVITEFFDYRCGYCRKVYPDLLRLIKEYPDLKIVLVELPYGGAVSTKAVKFSLAVYTLYPEKFYDFHTGLLNAASINDKVIYDLISQGNMDKAKLIENANSEEIEKLIAQNVQQATKVGVQGVPSFLINEEFVQGAASYSEFKKKLDAIKKS